MCERAYAHAPRIVCFNRKIQIVLNIYLYEIRRTIIIDLIILFYKREGVNKNLQIFLLKPNM